MSQEQNNVAEPTNVSQPETDVSQGFPVTRDQAVQRAEKPVESHSEPIEASGDAVEGQTEPEGSLVTPQERKASDERLRQQNARQAKLLQSLGIDPLSDIAEQLESGLITPDMVVQHVMSKHAPQGQPQQPQQVASDPVSQAQNAYLEAKAACEAEGKEYGQVSFETNQRYMEAAIALQDAKATSYTSQLAAQQQQEQANQNVEMVLTMARQNRYYPELPDNAKQISDFLHVAMTGAVADNEARQMGLDPARLTPKQVAYFAQKAQAQLGQLADSFIELGKRQARQPNSPTQPQTRTPMPTPAGAGGAAASMPNPFARVNHINHKDAARQYMAGGGVG